MYLGEPVEGQVLSEAPSHGAEVGVDASPVGCKFHRYVAYCRWGLVAVGVVRGSERLGVWWVWWVVVGLVQGRALLCNEWGGLGLWNDF